MDHGGVHGPCDLTAGGFDDPRDALEQVVLLP
jgi:hypothetical protein